MASKSNPKTSLRPGSVRLVAPHHEGYRRWASAMRKRKVALHGRGFGPSPADRLPYILEAAARHWLGRTFDLMEERIVAFEVAHGMHYDASYRELDIVCGRKNVPQLFIEVKSGRSRSMLADARAQVKTNTELLRTAWPEVRPAVLLLRDDDAPTLEQSPLVEYVEEPAALLASPMSDRALCLVMPSSRMFAYALEHGLCDQPDLYAQASVLRAEHERETATMLASAAAPCAFGSMASALQRWQRSA